MTGTTLVHLVNAQSSWKELAFLYPPFTTRMLSLPSCPLFVPLPPPQQGTFFRSFYLLPVSFPSSCPYSKPGGCPDPYDSGQSFVSLLLSTHSRGYSLHYWELLTLHLVFFLSSNPWLSFHGGQCAEGLPIRELLIWIDVNNIYAHCTTPNIHTPDHFHPRSDL